MIRPIVAISSLVLAGAIFFAYTQPTYDNTQSIRTQIASYDQALQKANELQKLKQDLLKKFNSFDQTNLDRVQKLLPDHVDNVRLILDLDSMANTYGMSLANVDISGNAASQGGATVLGMIGEGPQKYESIGIHFSTSSTLPNFLNFLADLQSSLRIVDLVSLSISPTGAQQVSRDSSKSEPVYSYAIALKTYWLK